MARRRASFASFTLWRSSASMLRFAVDVEPSGSLQAGQRLAKPGLSGFSSNSSEQTAQTRIGKAIQQYDKTTRFLNIRDRLFL
jgi:hypothetical protein